MIVVCIAIMRRRLRDTFEALMEEFERLVQGDDHFKEVRRQARDFFYCKEGQGMVGETLLGILKNIK